jgi:hypothetical protein
VPAPRKSPFSHGPCRACQSAARSYALDAIRRIELVQDGKAALSIAPGGACAEPEFDVKLGDCTCGKFLEQLVEAYPAMRCERAQAFMYTQLAVKPGPVGTSSAITASEGAAVSVTVVRELADAVVTIDDAGPGLPVAMYERSATGFERFDRSRSTGAGGFGLGFGMVAAVVRLHGGSLTLSPSPLGGLRTVVRIPAL